MVWSCCHTRGSGRWRSPFVSAWCSNVLSCAKTANNFISWRRLCKTNGNFKTWDTWLWRIPFSVSKNGNLFNGWASGRNGKHPHLGWKGHSNPKRVYYLWSNWELANLWKKSCQYRDNQPDDGPDQKSIVNDSSLKIIRQCNGMQFNALRKILKKWIERSNANLHNIMQSEMSTMQYRLIMKLGCHPV